MATVSRGEITITNVDDGKPSYTHTAYAWSADGTKRFTKKYPRENLALNNRIVTIYSNNSTSYPIKNTTMTEDGETFVRTVRINPELQGKDFSIYNGISIGSGENANNKLLGHKIEVSGMFRASRDSEFTMMFISVERKTDGKNKDVHGDLHYKKVNVTREWKQIGGIIDLTNTEGIDSLLTLRCIPYATVIDPNEGFYLDSKNYKVSIIDDNDEVVTTYTTPPTEDYENAYPKYEGFYSDTNQVGSDNPDDYKPWKPFMGPQGKDGYTPVKNVDYFDGQPGQNGKSAYLWIRYSQNADGSGMTTDPANAKYTGYATTETNVAPTSPSAYRWQQTKGDPGIGIPGEPGPDGKTSYLHIKYSNDGGLTFTGNGGEDGGDYIGQYVDFTEADSKKPSDYTWSSTKGSKGDKGDPAPLISLSGTTQAITVDKDGKITPASSFAVIGTAVNTAISNWTYSLNGGNFGSAVPTGVTRSGNTVTINPVTATFDTFTIKAADATVSDVFTISRIKDGGEGPPGSDAYTVFLTNESYTFAGSTTAALAGSTTTEVIVYKGINKITPTSITVGTKPTGLSSSVSGSIITLTATTALVSKSGIVPITIIADGKTFTKQFSYALSLQGGKGDPGDPGKGVSAEEISYAISQDGTTPPTSGWSGTRPTPKAGWYMWTRTRFKYTDNTYSAYFYLVAQQGKDAIIISASPPTNPSKEDLWQDPNDATGTVYRWDGTSWVHWGVSIDNLIVSNVQIENGVFKRVEGTVIVGSKFVNSFSYNDGGVTYTGSTTIEDGNVIIERSGSDGSTWKTSMDRSLGFQGTYKSGPSAPSRVTQLGQGKLYMVEAGVGGYLPAAALNPASWTNLSYAPGFTTAENNPCQYRKVQLVDGSWELQLRGQIKPTSGDFSTSASPTGGILPAGFRPIRNELVTAADSTKKGARVVVLATGEIQINTPNGGNYVSFGGIRIAL
ncbi:hypothetical protein [Enterococcus casseliflavus]|uniref:hypothetical protein n=1 Tax=Enterococcus casseliflavus TaxID=37734 RepID=UPI003D0A6ABA